MKRKIIKNIPILLYHRIDRESDPEYRPYCVSPENFRQQMAWLAQQGFKTISLADYYGHHRHGKRLPRRPVIITFDDGYYCNYTRAFPILQDYGFTATIFLGINFIRDETEVREGRDAYLSWQEIRKMQQAGFEFQAHGCSHRALDTLPPDEVESEARQSRDVIRQELGTPVDFFCYPYMRYNESVKRIIHDVGYKGACGGQPYWQNGARDWFEIGRTEILWSDSLAQFKFKLKNGLGYYYFTLHKLGNIRRKLARAVACWA